jgi:hypothetical protein
MTITMTAVTPGGVENSDSFGNYLIHGIDEVILPDPIAWWPTAPGWQVLGVFVLVLLVYQSGRAVKRWWQNRYRREALRQLALVQEQADNQLQDVVAMLPYYLKVTALQAYSRQDVASLSGTAWLMFLDTHYSGPSFSTGVGQKLLSVAYLPRRQWQLNDQESDTLIRMSRRWIAEHREFAHV